MLHSCKMSIFLDSQPAACRTTLPYRKINWNGVLSSEHHDKVAFYDPSDLYARIHEKLDPFARRQDLAIRTSFPNEKGICGCGCQVALTGRRTRWATEDCMEWASSIHLIIVGDNQLIAFYLRAYYGDKCNWCDRTPNQIYNEDLAHLSYDDPQWNRSYLMVDHIFPVAKGGGGSWLINYQLLCHKCHVEKTNEDFGWNQAKKLLKNQLKLDL